jgi:hypothetical protein
VDATSDRLRERREPSCADSLLLLRVEDRSQRVARTFTGSRDDFGVLLVALMSL